MSRNDDFQPVNPAEVPRFADVATFMRTRRHPVDPAVDVGLVGVPFDLGLNYRTGARDGPAGVRAASRIIRRILVDHARSRKAIKRGGGQDRITISNLDTPSGTDEIDLVAGRYLTITFKAETGGFRFR